MGAAIARESNRDIQPEVNGGYVSIVTTDGEVIQLQPATGDDREFAWLLYRDLMKPLTEEILRWDEQSQRAVVERSLAHQGTSIIVMNGSSVGWLQVDSTSSAIYLGQLYIISALQKRGIGTAIVKWLCGQARLEGKPVTLEVMKNNRALAFYHQLGFRVNGESKYKYEMRWQAPC